MIARREQGAWAIAFLLCGVIFWISQGPAPYRNVEVVRLERVGPDIEFVATFEKTACTFKRLTVVAGLAGETGIAPYRNLDAVDEGDRSTGKQTLRIAFPASIFDWMEIRTRHDCDGKKVDKVFYRIEPTP